MGILDNENLFLLEFLVEDIQLDKGKCDCMHQKTGQLCVGFQFLDNTELDVCEQDFNPDKRFTQANSDSRTGKSCLFSLTPSQAKAALESFDLNVHICRKTEPEKTVLGTVSISILEMLQELMESNEESPAAKVLQDTFKLKDTNGRSIGKISVYIRLSCYGKMIITQFQMNLDDKSVLFKDKDGRSLYRYKKSKRSNRETKIEDLTQNEQKCAPSCQSYKTVVTNVSPTPNINCPSQPCFPNNIGISSGGIGSHYPPNLPSPWAGPNATAQFSPFAIAGNYPTPWPDPYSNVQYPLTAADGPTSYQVPHLYGTLQSPPSAAGHMPQSYGQSPLFADGGACSPCPWSNYGASQPPPSAAGGLLSYQVPPRYSSSQGRQHMQTTKFSVGLGGSSDDGGAKGCRGGCGR